MEKPTVNSGVLSNKPSHPRYLITEFLRKIKEAGIDENHIDKAIDWYIEMSEKNVIKNKIKEGEEMETITLELFNEYWEELASTERVDSICGSEYRS